MNPNNPYVRLLAGFVAIAVAIRVIFELLAPVVPYLLAVVVVIGVVQVVRWWHNRW